MMKDKRLFMHFNKDEEQGGGGGDETTTTTEEVKDPKDQSQDTVPYSRFKEVNDAKKKAEDLLLAKTEQDEKDRLKKLEDDGELKQVNEALTQKLAALEPVAKKYAKLEQGIRDAALATLADKLGDDAAAPYAEFPTEQLQTVAQTIGKQTADPAPDDSHPGGRNVDVNEQAALKKYGSKNNLARLNRDLYRKLYPNTRRRLG
jgi:predicted nucleic acid-binding protein